MITDEEEARPKGSWSDLDRELSFALLDAIVAAGGTTFDTAHVYGIGGAGETGLGLWMAERGNRDDLVIIGKGGIRPSPPAPYKVTPSFIDADLFETLARLQTGYVDLYMMHYDDPAAPIGPLMDTLNSHLTAGRTRAIGCSNMAHQRFEEANEYADKHGIEPRALCGCAASTLRLHCRSMKLAGKCALVTGGSYQEGRCSRLALPAGARHRGTGNRRHRCVPIGTPPTSGACASATPAWWRARRRRSMPASNCSASAARSPT